MTRREIIEGYITAEKPYEVCMHSKYGGYLEFGVVEKGIMFEDNARTVCDKYAESLKKNPSETFIGVCVRKNGTIVYEVRI